MKHREVYDWFVRKCNVYLNSTCITRALKAARKIVEGDEIAQYGLVWDYANELLTSNPGSRVQVGVIPMPEGPPLFDRFYVCLDACKRGFKAGCRPLIGLDGAFLKTLHGGQILTACGQDANNHIFVIAYAIVSVKKRIIGNGFLNYFIVILETTERTNGASSQICRRKCFQEFTTASACGICGAISRNSGVVYLDKWPKEAWTKAHFSEVSKVDNICNNACESFNAKIKHERSKPILTLAEEVRRIIMKSMVDNRKKLQNYQGILPPVQQRRLEAMTVLSHHWAPQWSGDEKEELYEVHGWPTNMVVDLGKHTCTCRFWQLTDAATTRSCYPATQGAEPDLNFAPTDTDIGTEAEAPLPSLPSPTQPDSEIDSSRPPKLQVIKRKARVPSSPKHIATRSVVVSAETIKGTSSGTAKRLANFMTFVPTPGFKAPRKTDDKV
ncbi:uncharacterized protein LOC107636082 [Arachis ipaensis]|uniref:uncharacterized protein LOC107636082 n=1 Tax=Arachis ipaensis TaxID=130454 RepID=UPI0007AF4431|nr:uncharacterized protein LOC107636082 [Arachis ipaensis]XP_025647275.1 uncharacterized protein LOC112742252 [Arachis hypogaea]